MNMFKIKLVYYINIYLSVKKICIFLKPYDTNIMYYNTVRIL